MRLYPIWLDLRDQPVLLAGGGQVALRRATTLLSYDAQLTVVAPLVLPPFETWQREARIQLHRREFQEIDLEGCRLVFACTNDPSVNQRIVQLANAHGIWVESCTHAVGANIFPGGIIHTGSIGIAISSMGKAPSVTQALRECFEEILGGEWGKQIGRLVSEASEDDGLKGMPTEELKRKVRDFLKERIEKWRDGGECSS